MNKSLRRRLSDGRDGKMHVSPIPVFIIAVITSMCVLLYFFLRTHGGLISRYFFFDDRDTGMDFFHSIEYLHGRSPYATFNTLYPPLANLLFLVLYYLVPKNVTKNWTDSFLESYYMRNTELDLRTYQAPMVLFMLFILVAAWMLISLCVSCLKQQPARRANLVAFCMLFGPGMLYAFERGNILVIVVPLTLYFVMYRNSGNWMVRESALLALAVAAGLKLYPAFFGVLLIRDKKYKEAVRAIVYGILSVVVPALFFKEGLAGIPMWLSVVFSFGSKSEQPWVGTGFTSILHRIALYGRVYLGITIETSWFSVAAMVVSATLLIVSLWCKKEWQSILAIAMAVIMFHSQGNYVFSLLCIPMLLFLAQEWALGKRNVIPFLLMLLLSVHLPLFHIGYVSYPNVAVKQLISLLLVCWCFFDAGKTGIQGIKRGKQNEKLEK